MQNTLFKKIEDATHVQKMLLEKLRREQDRQTDKFKDFMLLDPLPPERIEKLKNDIKEELEETLRPSRSKTIRAGGVASSGSAIQQSEHEMSDLDED